MLFLKVLIILDKAQNMLTFSRRCSTPLNVFQSWASFGGETGGHVPPTFWRVGDTISNVPPTFFELVCVSPQKSYILINLD